MISNASIRDEISKLNISKSDAALLLNVTKKKLPAIENDYTSYVEKAEAEFELARKRFERAKEDAEKKSIKKAVNSSLNFLNIQIEDTKDMGEAVTDNF
ncbi:MAG: hypothetical protein KKE17_15725 [Proteobacteria bacterium]|nr:hypothetical protein [Pseudomonadota bacterium]MBU1901902.1 hypothetical protein [Patescibacteria group bacterium]